MSGVDDLIAFIKARLSEDPVNPSLAHIHDLRDVYDASLQTMPCATLQAIAAVWSGHPDYRTEWKP
jgi:uncharacterized protein DUF6221